MWPLGQERRRKEKSCWSLIPGQTGTIGVYPFRVLPCLDHWVQWINEAVKQESLLSSPVTVVYSQQNYKNIFRQETSPALRVARKHIKQNPPFSRWGVFYTYGVNCSFLLSTSISCAASSGGSAFDEDEDGFFEDDDEEDGFLEDDEDEGFLLLSAFSLPKKSPAFITLSHIDEISSTGVSAFVSLCVSSSLSVCVLFSCETGEDVVFVGVEVSEITTSSDSFLQADKDKSIKRAAKSAIIFFIT